MQALGLSCPVLLGEAGAGAGRLPVSAVRGPGRPAGLPTHLTLIRLADYGSAW